MTETMRKAILSRDPDCWEMRPTDVDYDNFKAWVTSTYGARVWREYNRFRIGGTY